jgi:hypothetical protein
MKKILLAVTGGSPREEALKYSLGLAQRLKAKLEVLQVVGPSMAKGWHKVRRGLSQGGRMLESTMATAAFAEAGLDYEVTTREGDPTEEIVQFVEDNQDVVLAVFDTDDPGNEAVSPQDLGQQLAIPTVAIARRPDRGEPMSKVKVKRKSRVSKLTEAVDRYQEAVTYAEANMPAEAVAALERPAQAPPMILVVGRDGNFSEALREYSVGLADRLGYEIVAVNTKNIPGESAPRASEFREHLRQDFTEKSLEAAESFRAQCELAGICFTHEVKFGETTDVIRDLHLAHPRLDYVLTEPDETVQRPAGVKPAIPVFALATN